MEFFVAAKLFWLLAEPTHLAMLLLALAAGLLFTRFFRPARWVIAGLTLAAFGIGLWPGAQWVARPIENRFPRPDWPACVDGIVLLGGGEQLGVSAARGIPVARFAGRYLAAVELLRRYPNAHLYFSGGAAALGPTGITESDVVRRVFEQLGVDLSRVSFESRSRNTWENFEYTKALAHPRPGQTWVLVTQAIHMPRSIGIARRLDWEFVPWPTDFMTRPAGPPRLRFPAIANWTEFDGAVREWIGLTVYYLTGRSSEWLPRPITPPPADVTCHAAPDRLD